MSSGQRLSNETCEVVIKELNFILENLCQLELTMKGRHFIYRRINQYKDEIRNLQRNSENDNRTAG